VIGKGYRRHAVFDRLLHQIADADGPVKKGVLGMHVKVNEFREFHNTCRKDEGSRTCRRLPFMKGPSCDESGKIRSLTT